jgi:hypothetical protein
LERSFLSLVRKNSYPVCTNRGGIEMLDGKETNMGLKIVDAVSTEINEMVAGWKALFPGE